MVHNKDCKAHDIGLLT